MGHPFVEDVLGGGQLTGASIVGVGGEIPFLFWAVS